MQAIWDTTATSTLCKCDVEGCGAAQHHTVLLPMLGELRPLQSATACNTLWTLSGGEVTQEVTFVKHLLLVALVGPLTSHAVSPRP